jgi:hypothetical protein
MIHGFSEKVISVIAPQSVATNATPTGNIDRLGFDYVAVDVQLDSQTSTTSKPATLKLTESDDTVATNFAAITAFTGGTQVNTTSGFVIPNAQAGANVFRFGVDCRARKRYLKVSVTSGDAAQIMGVTASLRRAKEVPATGTATAHASGGLVMG